MSKTWKTRLIKYGSCALFVGLMAYLYFSMWDFHTASLVDKYRMLCDAMTVPGVLLLMMGALVWLSNEGAFLGIGWALSWTVRSLIPGGRGLRDETYAEYVERKTANRVRGYGFLFISGGITMAAALVFLALYHSVG